MGVSFSTGIAARRVWRLLVFCGLALGLLEGGPARAVTFPLSWRWANPAPHGSHIYDILNFGDNVLEVGEKGSLYASADLDAWLSHPTGTTNALRSGTLLGNRLVVTGAEGSIVYGDSLDHLRFVKLPTSAWLEGVAASSNLVVAVGDAGAIYSSPNGIDWTRRGSFSTWFSSVAYGLGRFVAVGESGSVAISPDGADWSLRTLASTGNLNRIFWIQDRFWVVGDGGTVLTNTGRFGWIPVAVGVTNDLFGIAGNTNANEILVVGDSAVVLRDGSGNWTNQVKTGQAYTPPAWTYYAGVWAGTEYLIGGRSGMAIEGFRTNSASRMFWVDDADSPRNWLWSMTRLPDFYAAAGNAGTVMTSEDGIVWTKETVPVSAQGDIFLGIGGGTNLLVAVGSSGSVIKSPALYTNVVQTNIVGGQPVVSTNRVNLQGVVWQAVEPRFTTADLQGVAEFGGLTVVTGGGGAIHTSRNGADWAKQNSRTSAFLSGVAHFPGGWVAVGDSGTILGSSDGTQWSTRLSGVTNWVYQVRYTGGLLVAVGESGLVLTSPDGVTWSKRTTPTTSWLNDAGYADGQFFAVGSEGVILASPNGAVWSLVPTITSKSLYGLAFQGNQMVVAGTEGAILRTRLNPDLSPVNFVNLTHGVDYDAFLISGHPDQRFFLESGSAFTNWVSGANLEIQDPSGTLIFTQPSTANTRLYFRTRLEN